MNDITALLRAAHGGDDQAAGQAVALLYDELRRQARSRLRRAGELTLLDTTALVHESYLRIRQAGMPHFEDRRHFLAYACKAMRNIVIDIARAQQADRRGGAAVHVTLDTALGDSLPAQGEDVLRVHEALQELADIDPRLGQVVEMRYFGGLSEPEIAECLGVTERTVQRDWKKARLFLSMTLR